MLRFHPLYDTECPAADFLNNKTPFYTYRYSVVVTIRQTRGAIRMYDTTSSLRPASQLRYGLFTNMVAKRYRIVCTIR